ncbi:hypothetical protein, partial [Xanthomonas arboricola]|uniref:hypothetical protein n=1 Tax=Xanthomonas arboricola TaxID=56448 RepID=UPI001C613683
LVSVYLEWYVAEVGDEALQFPSRLACCGEVLGHVPLKVDAHQWQARKDAYAMRQLSFFRCWYFFSFMSA